MARCGYTLFCEGNDPLSLIDQAVMAEEAGFDFLVISDHIHPWLTNQEHSAFAWSVLGAVAAKTKKIQLATMVTCPIVRYHPVIVAQMAATTGVISNGRFTLGLGAGERLNEHVVGYGWPAVHERHARLNEAIEIITELWKGDYLTYEGEYYTAEDVRIFDLPEQPIPFFVAASGKASASVAARAGGGVCMTEPSKVVVSTFVEQGGDAKNTWGQVVTGWAENEEQGLKNAHEQFRFSAGGWKVQAELPNPVNFDAATQNVRPEDLAESIPAGPDAQKHLDGIQKFADAGVNHIALAYPGQDFRGFMNFWSSQLKPKLM